MSATDTPPATATPTESGTPSDFIVAPRVMIDNRPVESLTFGIEAPLEEREAVAARVREFLLASGCKVGDDVRRLGCTGVAKVMRALDPKLPYSPIISQGKFLRLGLAGSGIGLTCFVPPSRYCLVHETIGGLEDGQKQYHAEYVNAVSRELTPQERATVAVIERARRSEERTMSGSMRDATDLLTGRKKKEAVAAVTEAEAGEEEEVPADAEAKEPARQVEPLPEPWTCPEHKKTDWRCRYCAAQAIVEGPLELTYAVDVVRGDGNSEQAVVNGVAVDQYIADCDGEGKTGVILFARVAVFTRKLSRD
jgi:hypothetical protein